MNEQTPSVAQSGSHPTGDQSGPAIFFNEDWSWNIFYGQSLPTADSRKAAASFWRKNAHKYWLMEDSAFPDKVYIR